MSDDPVRLDAADPPAPPFQIVGTVVRLRAPCLILWHGGGWAGPAPVFVTDMRARLSVASDFMRLVEWGCN